MRFETLGVVTLGCNIHDWMLGYIVVLDTPYVAQSGTSGDARLLAPPGRYTLQVWSVSHRPMAACTKGWARRLESKR